MEDIKKEAAKRDFVCDREDIAVLAEELKHDTAELKARSLAASYSGIRRVRGDGNCFVRAFGFGLLEHLIGQQTAVAAGKMTSPTALPEVMAMVSASKDLLLSEGFSEFIEDFWEVLVEQLEHVATGDYAVTAEAAEASGKTIAEVQKEAMARLRAAFNDQSITEYVICYLRLMTSAFLQRNAALYEFFLEGVTMKEFCLRDVEPMAVESDQLQIIALASVFSEPLGRGGVRIQYLDATDSTTCTVHSFPEDQTHSFLHLLYRPGHYDILYPRE